MPVPNKATLARSLKRILLERMPANWMDVISRFEFETIMGATMEKVTAYGGVMKSLQPVSLTPWSGSPEDEFPQRLLTLFAAVIAASPSCVVPHPDTSVEDVHDAMTPAPAKHSQRTLKT